MAFCRKRLSIGETERREQSREMLWSLRFSKACTYNRLNQAVDRVMDMASLGYHAHENGYGYDIGLVVCTYIPTS